MIEIKVAVDDQPIGTISPRLYGFFAEHLGRCCYGGLWSGASGSRPATLGMSCGLQVADDNSLGTHEFLRLEALGPDVDLVDHLSVHRYWVRGGPEAAFGEGDYYALFDEAEATERLIERTAQLVARMAKPGHPIAVALDEWGVWHPEAREWGPGDVPRRTPATFEQANTLRDALAAGIAFEGFHRQCRVLSMANLAQIVNVLQSLVATDEGSCVRSPTYHAFALHRAQIGAQADQVEVEPAAFESAGRPGLSATASSRGDGLTVTLINRDYRRPVVANISVAGLVTSSWVLSADSPQASNTPADPERVAPRALSIDSHSARSHTTTLPPHSMATIQFAARS